MISAGVFGVFIELPRVIRHFSCVTRAETCISRQEETPRKEKVWYYGDVRSDDEQRNYSFVLCTQTHVRIAQSDPIHGTMEALHAWIGMAHGLWVSDISHKIRQYEKARWFDALQVTAYSPVNLKNRIWNRAQYIFWMVPKPGCDLKDNNRSVLLAICRMSCPVSGMFESGCQTIKHLIVCQSSTWAPEHMFTALPHMERTPLSSPCCLWLPGWLLLSPTIGLSAQERQRAGVCV